MERLILVILMDLEFLLMNPSTLFALVHASVTCLDHVSLSVTHTPRSFSEFVDSDRRHQARKNSQLEIAWA